LQFLPPVVRDLDRRVSYSFEVETLYFICLQVCCFNA